MKNKRFYINIVPSNDLRSSDPSSREVLEAAIKSDHAKIFRYSLVTVGQGRHSPWVVAQLAMERISDFSPLIAVNPAYQHPVSVAKSLVSLNQLYPSSIALNLVSGSFMGELESIHDFLALEGRNQRLGEFLQILRGLFSPAGASSFEGKFYSVTGAKIFPLWRGPQPPIFVSGTLAGNLTDDAETYFIRNIRPKEMMKPAPGPRHGLGLGICARKTHSEAEEALRKNYPEDRRGEILFSMALKNSSTDWNRWLKAYLDEKKPEPPGFSLRPMRYSWSSAPYIVGSHESVASEISELAGLGYEFFLLDYHPQDYEHVRKVIELADSQ